MFRFNFRAIDNKIGLKPLYLGIIYYKIHPKYVRQCKQFNFYQLR